jgi:hypothetical protein
VSWPRPYKRLPLYVVLAFACGVLTHAYVPVPLTHKPAALPPVHPVGRCHDELSLRLRQSLLLRPQTWTTDGFRIEGHGMSIWVANGQDSLNTSEDDNALPRTADDGSTVPEQCAAVLYSAIKRWQRAELSRKLEAD